MQKKIIFNILILRELGTKKLIFYEYLEGCLTKKL